MVSTRQMATNNSGCSNSNPNCVDESGRLSVVTRQTAVLHSVNGVLVTMSMPNQPSSSVRHLQTQAFKVNGEVGGSARVILPERNFLDMPNEILSKIFSYLCYKKLAQVRTISTKVNDVCMQILNATFSKLIKKTYNHFQTLKASMPRRESARRNHPLACECDIIETCYMRLSLLQMTFGKHIERGHCCFFPGAVLDEVYAIINYIKTTPHVERPFRVTDELFDLSTMAMEYFRDHIEPGLPDIAYFNKDFFGLPTATKRPSLVKAMDLSEIATNSSPPQSNMVLRKGIRKIKQGMKIYNNQLSLLRNELRTCKRKTSEQSKQIAEQQKLIAEQQKQTLEYANRLDENDKKNEEISRKFSTLLQELNKCRTELQYWRSKSPAMSSTSCVSCGHIIAPILAPEDCINRGVKPEDMFIDGESSYLETEPEDACKNQLPSGEFVLPDQLTTNKLLAVNIATKNLKRHYSASNCGHSDVANEVITREDNMPIVKSNEIIICASSSCKQDEKKCQGFVNKILAISCDKVEANEIGHAVSCNVPNECNTNSTKTFNGTNATGHKGVIVSPTMAAKKEFSSSSAAFEGNIDMTAATAGNNVIADISSLQTMTSHETKKARRVQKATRCINGSGKRK